jgi:hypothetical protein
MKDDHFCVLAFKVQKMKFNSYKLSNCDKLTHQLSFSVFLNGMSSKCTTRDFKHINSQKYPQEKIHVNPSLNHFGVAKPVPHGLWRWFFILVQPNRGGWATPEPFKGSFGHSHLAIWGWLNHPPFFFFFFGLHFTQWAFLGV